VHLNLVLISLSQKHYSYEHEVALRAGVQFGSDGEIDPELLEACQKLSEAYTSRHVFAMRAYQRGFVSRKMYCWYHRFSYHVHAHAYMLYIYIYDVT
jgi:hypothetical protein